MEHGSFVFRDNGDGCITAKYIHDDLKKDVFGPFSEACVRTGGETDGPFSGIYDSVWLEHNRKHVKAKLSITLHPNNDSIFTLVWFTKDISNPLFEGIGMLYDGLLVGTYWLS